VTRADRFNCCHKIGRATIAGPAFRGPGSAAGSAIVMSGLSLPGVGQFRANPGAVAGLVGELLYLVVTRGEHVSGPSRRIKLDPRVGNERVTINR
jgi:hypothetical protein